MASIEVTGPKYFARDIISFSDTQLDQYLEDHRLDGGAMFVEVEDPENLPQSFIQRLRDRAQHASDTNQSRPVDPSQLTSRLLDLSSDRNTSPRPPPPPPPFDRESSTETASRIPDEELEERDYDALVKEGGRPLYHRELIDRVAKDPFSYWDMLRPWLDHVPNFVPEPDPDADIYVDWSVFGNQLRSWRDFSDWQKFNRGDFTLWDESYEVRAAYHYFVPAFRRKCPTYTDAVKKLLAEYGFTRPFQFHEDPIHQDKLTTWIEYLGYECWLHYRYARRVRHMQPKYDAAWKKLIDSGMLRPFETEEYICDIESAIGRQIEEDQATRSVTLASSASEAVLTSVYNDINSPQGSRLTSTAHAQMIASAKSRCETAEEAFRVILKRNDLVTEFKQSVGKYLTAKEEAWKHNNRVRWALEQVSLIEVELNESSMSPKSARGVERSLERDEDNDGSHGRVIKEQRRDASAPGPSSGHSGSLGNQSSKLKRSCNDTATLGPPSKRPKRDGKDLDITLGRSIGPDYQKVNIKRLCEDATDDRPPSKRLKRRGEDLGLHNGTRAKSKRNRDNATDDGPPSKRLRRRGEDLGPHNGTGAKLKRNRDNATDDGPPSKRLRRRGEDLNLQSETRDGINSGSADFHEPDAFRTMASLTSKRSEPVSDHPQRRTSTRSVGQPSPTTQPLRRSARIAARHLSNTVKNIPQSSRQSMTSVPKPTLRMDLQDQQSRHLATKARTQSARVSERHGKPGRGK